MWPAWEIPQPPRKCVFFCTGAPFPETMPSPFSRQVRGQFRVACVGDSATVEKNAFLLHRRVVSRIHAIARLRDRSFSCSLRGRFSNGLSRKNAFLLHCRRVVSQSHAIACDLCRLHTPAHTLAKWQEHLLTCARSALYPRCIHACQR